MEEKQEKIISELQLVEKEIYRLVKKFEALYKQLDEDSNTVLFAFSGVDEGSGQVPVNVYHIGDQRAIMKILYDLMEADGSFAKEFLMVAFRYMQSHGEFLSIKGRIAVKDEDCNCVICQAMKEQRKNYN